MGAVLSAIGALGAAVGSAIIASAETLGLIVATYSAQIGLASLASSSTLGVTLTFTGYQVTTLGAAILSGVVTTAVATTIAGLSIGLVDRSPTPLVDQFPGGLLPFLDGLPPLICRGDQDAKRCKRVSTDSRVPKMRVYDREAQERPMLSNAKKMRVARSGQQNSRKNGNAPQRRKVPVKNKRLRR